MTSTTAPRERANSMTGQMGSAPPQHEAVAAQEKIPERQRGIFNFLTWPFFLAPVMADPHVVGGFVRAAMASEEQARLQAQADLNADPSGELPALTDHSNSVDEPTPSQSSAGASELPTPRFELREPPDGNEPSEQAQARSTADNDVQSPSSGGGGALQAPEQIQTGMRAGDAAVRVDHASGSATSPTILGSELFTASLANLPGAGIATPFQALDQAARIDLAQLIDGISALPNATLSGDVISEIAQSATALATRLVQDTEDTVRDASALVVSGSDPLQVVLDTILAPAQSVQTIVELDEIRDLAGLRKLAAPQELLQGLVSAIPDLSLEPDEAVSDLVDKIASSPISSALNTVADGIGPATETLVQTVDASLDELAKGISTPVDALTSSLASLPGAVIATPLQALDQAARVDLAHTIDGMSALSNAVSDGVVSEIPQSATALVTSVVQDTVDTAREASSLVVSPTEPLQVALDTLLVPVQSAQTIVELAEEQKSR